MFSETGVYLRLPGGNVENIADQKPVVRWAALNVGGDVGRDPSKWDHQRPLYASAGIASFPWLHCQRLEDVDFLISVGQQWGSPAIGLNIEDIQTDFRQNGLTLEGHIAPRLATWAGEIHMATLPWVQNGQGWSSLDRAVAALEIFADEQKDLFPDRMPDPKVIQACVDHAFAEGLSKVTLMFKTKNHEATSYDLSVCHSLYTADDITPTPEAWAAWVEPGAARPPVPTAATREVAGDPNWHEKRYPRNRNSPRVAFVRPLYPPDAAARERTPSLPGPDVRAVKRAISRAQRYLPWTPQDWDEAYDDEFAHGDGAGLERSGVAGFQEQMGIEPTGWVGNETFEALRTCVVPAKPGVDRAGEPLFDSVCIKLLRAAADLVVPAPELAFPLRRGSGGSVSLSELHVTEGLEGNWALDFVANEGTPVIAPEEATVAKLSGRAPSLGASPVADAFGWSIHLETADGYRYVAMHLGRRAKLSVGETVEIGQLLGEVGAWPGDPARSHLHLGVTSPNAEDDAKARIQAVGAAPRRRPLV
jgi:murein DD-endopeptidase MepM/ murein hydrolase activator NlpD